jgi:hypothetical protein
MNRRKTLLALLLGVCAAIPLVLVQRTSPHHERAVAGTIPESGEMDYTVTRKFKSAPKPFVQSELTIQFTFDGDHTISPGSLKEMTKYMREAEIEIATKLGREIKFPE